MVTMALEHVSRDGLHGNVGKEFNQLHGTGACYNSPGTGKPCFLNVFRGEPGFYSEMKGRQLEQSPG